MQRQTTYTGIILQLGFLIMLLAVACAPKNYATALRVRIPWFTDNGKYALQDVELNTIHNLENVSGDAAVFFDNVYFTRNSITGDSVKARFSITSDDVYIPTNFKSLNLITVYAHIEKLNELTNKAGGLDLLSLPRKIAVNPHIRNLNELNNAFYLGTHDATVITPYSEADLPTSMNGGILAHEYFHALFYPAVMKQLYSEYELISESVVKEDVIYNNCINGGDVPAEIQITDAELQKIFLRAINEGLADVWAWIYTGDNKFMGATFKISSLARDLGSSFDHLPSMNGAKLDYEEIVRGLSTCKFRRNNLIKGFSEGKWYFWGSRLARGVVKWWRTKNKEMTRLQREELAGRIVKAIKSIPLHVKNDKKPLSFNTFINALLVDESPSKEECEVLNGLAAYEEANGVQKCAR